VDWDKVVIGRRARVRLETGLAEGDVVEVAGRVLGRGAQEGDWRAILGDVDPGWARVRLDDDTLVIVHQRNIVEMLDD
jgi:hypothetical protein